MLLPHTTKVELHFLLLTPVYTPKFSLVPSVNYATYHDIRRPPFKESHANQLGLDWRYISLFLVEFDQYILGQMYRSLQPPRPSLVYSMVHLAVQLLAALFPAEIHHIPL